MIVCFPIFCSVVIACDALIMTECAFVCVCVRFLLNPAAISDDHMLQFRFLGILMAVAVRTKKPLDLHLAPWVWKQLCSIPLGGADLEEVDLLTHRSLQDILNPDHSSINEDNFTVVRNAGRKSQHLMSEIQEILLIVITNFLCVDDSSGLICGPQCGRKAGAGDPRWPQPPANLLQQGGVRGAGAGVSAA